MNPDLAQSILARMIARTPHHSDQADALLDALYATRRAVWNPTRHIDRNEVRR